MYNFFHGLQLHALVWLTTCKMSHWAQGTTKESVQVLVKEIQVIIMLLSTQVLHKYSVQFSSVQLLSHVRLFATP